MVHKHAPLALFHCDAVQAASAFDLVALVEASDLLSLSAHKFGGPKGTGILVIKDKSKVRPLALGGSQEKDLRPGTHDLASIAAMTVALEEAQRRYPTAHASLTTLRDNFETAVAKEVPEAIVTGVDVARSPAITHLLLPESTSEELLFLLDQSDVAASGGAACASGALDPSHVLLAMGIEPRRAKGALRFSFSPSNSVEEVQCAAKALGVTYRRLVRR